MKVSLNSITILFIVIGFAACTCEPAPYGRSFAGLNTRVVGDTIGQYRIAILIDPMYSEKQDKSRKAGCLGYYKVKGFYYKDSLITESIRITCKEKVAHLNAGMNWYGDSLVYHSINRSAGLPASSIILQLGMDAATYRALPDTLHFTVSGKGSSGTEYTGDVKAVLN